MVGWPGFRATSDQLPRLFGHGENIAVILGPPSGELVDLDLDCAEALALADLYLPPTRAVFARASKPSAHRLYVAPVAAYEAFADPLTGDMLIGLRATGRDGGAHMTLFPPSVADGERREWRGDVVAPAGIEAIKLRTSCATSASRRHEIPPRTYRTSYGRPIMPSAVAAPTGSACLIPTRRGDTRDHAEK